MFVFVFVKNRLRWGGRARRGGQKAMVIKKLLRFYFSAGSLERALNNLIEGIACKSADGIRGCGYYADKISAIINVKAELSEIWAKLNGIIRGMSERDKTSLKRYASLRAGVSKLDISERRELHRATVKFTRRAQGRLKSAGTAYRTLCMYYGLINPEPDG